uniref:DUF4220 domain-containing protein n=1 Tax=Ananas comosus var. bracteatus TaxID=296719 RepID=A0A6V7PQU0_ANACO|nr:unnamed protein product [Ananas comosus var. bracteatus]
MMEEYDAKIKAGLPADIDVQKAPASAEPRSAESSTKRIPSSPTPSGSTNVPVIEVELGFVYDIVYTKAAVVHSRLGYALRLIGSACIAAAFLAFFFANKRGFTRLDVDITYALLAGAAVLDFAALVMLLCSDWALVSFAEKGLFKECCAPHQQLEVRAVAAAAVVREAEDQRDAVGVPGVPAGEAAGNAVDGGGYRAAALPRHMCGGPPVLRHGRRQLTPEQERKRLLQVNTDVPPAVVKGDRSKSVLFDACILAKRLLAMGERKWEVMSAVWAEMLAYTACHCQAREHARQLSRGGELATVVWLLMAHVGLGKLYQIQAGDARAKLIVDK